MFIADAVKPADIISMSGYVPQRAYAPATSDWPKPDKALERHLEPGTKVFTFAIVTVGVLPDGLDLSKLDDKNYR